MHFFPARFWQLRSGTTNKTTKQHQIFYIWQNGAAVFFVVIMAHCRIRTLRWSRSPRFLSVHAAKQRTLYASFSWRRSNRRVVLIQLNTPLCVNAHTHLQRRLFPISSFVLYLSGRPTEKDATKLICKLVTIQENHEITVRFAQKWCLYFLIAPGVLLQDSSVLINYLLSLNYSSTDIQHNSTTLSLLCVEIWLCGNTLRTDINREPLLAYRF